MAPEAIFKALADPIRVRILQVLVKHELGVSDLVDVLGLPQSTVSRHLKVLRESGLLQARHHGTSSTYFPAPAGANGTGGLREQLTEWAAGEDLPPTTARRLREVLQRRRSESDAYFARIVQRWDQLRLDCFGDAFHLEAMIALLPNDWVAADVGTGTGYLLPVLGRSFRAVIAVDPVPEMLEAARQRVATAGLTNVEFRSGTVTRTGLADGEVDLCIASLVLHHEPTPAEALIELKRGLKAGGRLLIIEQQSHQLQPFHELMQDRWWGFVPAELVRQAQDAGFANAGWRPLHAARPTSASAPQAPELFVVTATRP
jgi:ArsR family transcriptional regulator